MNSSTMLVCTGVLHNSFVFVMPKYRNVLFPMIKKGWVNSVNAENSALFWFLTSGFLMIIGGKLMKNQKRINKEAGWWMAGLGVVGGVALPVSGFWLVAAQGLYIVSKDADEKSKD
jgi:hypothetical protein